MDDKMIIPDAIRRVVLRIQLAWYVFFITVLVTANSYFKRVRMSHENGVVCRGHIRVVDEPTFPQHPFFVPGREFGCRVRHAAASWLDDAKLVVRSASIKFADDRFESPLDLMMNSGDVPLFWDARTFWGFMKGTMGGRGKGWVPYLRANPQAMVGGADSVRRDPDSFAAMMYATKSCLGFVDDAGRYHYVRYRLRPVGFSGVESGMPDATDRAHPWLQNPLPGETRNRNYLKDELIHRLNVEGRPVRYMLQIQVRPRPDPRGPEPEWVTSQFPWDADAHPWHDVAEVTLTEALDYRESMMTWFDMANHPDSLPVPLGASIDDPHSMNNLRVASIWARKARLLSYRHRGMPKKFPDSRRASDWIGVPPMTHPPD
jgi:hypothetical protein